MPVDDQATSRRRFLQFLAASPFFAASDLAAFASETPSRLPDPMIWAPRNLDKLISSPKEAINVFDFEQVMAKNVPPAHFNYMASGIDDEEWHRPQPASMYTIGRSGEAASGPVPCASAWEVARPWPE